MRGIVRLSRAIVDLIAKRGRIVIERTQNGWRFTVDGPLGILFLLSTYLMMSVHWEEILGFLEKVIIGGS